MKNMIGMPLVGRSLRNLFSRPATRRYPTEIRVPIVGSHGHIVIDLASCTFCGLCARRCAPVAIVVDRGQKTLSLEHLRCIACGVCTEVCKTKSLTMVAGAMGAYTKGEAGPTGTAPRGVQKEQRVDPEVAKPAPAAAAAAEPAAPAAAKTEPGGI